MDPAAGDGVASAGKTLALSMARQGLAVYSYNSYQSVIRGGHSYLRLRISAKKPLNQGDQVDILIALNQDTLDRHLQELAPGGVAIYNKAKQSDRLLTAAEVFEAIHVPSVRDKRSVS